MPTEGSPTPTYPQYTNLALGEGLFDQLMASVKHHLEIEWKAQRITGDSYSKVYLGSMESVLGNTTQYLLGLLLIDEKKEQALAEVRLTEARIDLTEEDIRQKQYETDFILPKQLEKLDKEIELIGEQILKTQAEVVLLGAQVALTNAQASLTAKQEDKIDKEIEFLDAKIQTEKANTIGGIADANSLVGRQISLLHAQKLGFAGDLQSKVGKVFADYDAVFQSVQEVPEAATLRSDAQGALGSALTTAGSIEGV